MKVIFLDIDGVMNSTEEMIALYNQYGPSIDNTLPSPTKCKLLKQLVDETGAKVVLSSSWRLSLNAIQKLIDLFETYNLVLSGFTCHEVESKKFKNTLYEDIEPRYQHTIGGFGTYIEDRGAEIAAWLLDHPQVEKFIILDDEENDIRHWFPNNLIKTNMKFGLTEKEVANGIKILGGNYESR
jgi:hypothetical protein